MKLARPGLMILFFAAFFYGQKIQPATQTAANPQTAVELIQIGKLSEAEKLLREIVKQNPQNIDAKFLLGTLMIQANKPDEGVKILESVVRQNPKHLQANYNLALTYSGRGDNKKAIPYLEKAAGINPQNKKPKLFRGWS